jgi:hypothetical protein
MDIPKLTDLYGQGCRVRIKPHAEGLQPCKAQEYNEGWCEKWCDTKALPHTLVDYQTSAEITTEPAKPLEVAHEGWGDEVYRR